METTQKEQVANTRRDLHQQLTDTIIGQLEQGTVPWHKPWKGDDNRLFAIPKNSTTGNHYRGVNILLLWSSAIAHDYPTQEWASFKQWQANNESVKKGEKGNMIVYYDIMEKEVDGEVKKIQFLKASYVFNRSQLASYTPPEKNETANPVSLVERIRHVDEFIANTGAIVEHKDNTACYIPSQDKILMPPAENFLDTESHTATEGYYATLLHELTHWTGSKARLNREGGKKFGDENYSTEELVGELGAAFMCSEFDITKTIKTDHASYIAHWLKVLKDNKRCILTAASDASKAVYDLKGLQPKS